MTKIPQFFVGLISLLYPISTLADQITLYFPPSWKTNQITKAKTIAQTLSKDSGLQIRPLIAKTYPRILKAFAEDKPALAYAGSFIQVILYNRKQSTNLVHVLNGHEFYTSFLVTPRTAGANPIAIINTAGSAVAFAKGTSSGESAAKSATNGKATIATLNHRISINAINSGKAKAAFVKDWWWLANQDRYPNLQYLSYPEVSNIKHPDNVLSANHAVSATAIAKIRTAALKNAMVFDAKAIIEFDPTHLNPSIVLMKNGNIDPHTYAW